MLVSHLIYGGRMRFRIELFSIFLSVMLIGCASTGGTRIDNIPMYGQPEIERPKMLKKVDEAFIKKASSGFGTREEASKAWFAQGERFLSEGNLDYGMRRYNPELPTESRHIPLVR